MREFIDAAAFKEMILCADTALQARIQAINDLNVFPVPDGDTGTNMGLTIQNAATELRKRDFDTVAAAADCVASAMLRGARGNSGVILSLLFRGIARRLKGMDSAGAAEFTAAMNDGVEAAYKAVMKPAEGTILTVSRLASAAAAKAVKGGAVLEDALCSAIEAGDLALEDTVNQNPVLKKAGVVDAGGMGYMVILKAILSSLRGELISVQPAPAPEQKKPVFTAENVFVPEINIYDTVYVVRKRDPNVNLTPLRLYLDSIGDSLVINEDSEIFKVHVHTDIPGDALRESLKYGDLDIAKIENMRLQALDMIGGVKPKSTDDLEDVEKELEGEGCEAAAEPEEAEPEKEYGVVTVCAGEGLETLFRDLGVDQVVTGGQTMNPSTDDILRAVKATPASTVFVFPNNKNIIMAAEQCAPLTEKHVIVMPTKTVPQGISAMLNFNPDEPEESLVGAMGEAIGKVHTAMVTYAARDSDFGGHAIRAGEYLALLDGALVGSYTNLKTLFKELTWAFDDFHPEFITVY
ncbi:MAG: DAK2 domain-containing protein, partial [Oscillospiraceae bacterium]|nr:DAK2 domain-containing protein [Oscillospiraceae bacterium]